jgi:hypothetical protein
MSRVLRVRSVGLLASIGRAARAPRTTTYGNPPGAGAGSTGFVSSNPRRLPKGTPRPGTLAAGKPLSIVPDPKPSDQAAKASESATRPGAEPLPASSAIDARRAVRRVEPPPVTEPDIRGPLRRRAPRSRSIRARWLNSTVRLGYGIDRYEGSVREDTRYLASLGLGYKLTRST